MSDELKPDIQCPCPDCGYEFKFYYADERAEMQAAIRELADMVEKYAETALETLYNNKPEFVALIRRVQKGNV